jgi:hypothetical protein
MQNDEGMRGTDVEITFVDDAGLEKRVVEVKGETK